MKRKRIVIAGLGDSGVLTASRLARRAEVIGISAKPALVSGQELGWRPSRPHDWARTNWIPFDRFRGLDRVRAVALAARATGSARSPAAAAEDLQTAVDEPARRFARG